MKTTVSTTEQHMKWTLLLRFKVFKQLLNVSSITKLQAWNSVYVKGDIFAARILCLCKSQSGSG